MHPFFITAHRQFCETLVSIGEDDERRYLLLDVFIDRYLYHHFGDERMWFFYSYAYVGSDETGGVERGDDGYYRSFYGDRSMDEFVYSRPLLHGPPHPSQLDRIQRPYEDRYESAYML